MKYPFQNICKTGTPFFWIVWDTSKNTKFDISYFLKSLKAISRITKNFKMAFDRLSKVKWKQDKIEFSMYAFECGNAVVFAYACT